MSKYDPWEDRPEHRRPTKERLARGAMRLVDGENAGGKIAYDDASTPLRDCWSKGLIGRHQLDAGEKFEGLCRSRMGSPGPRSCLDWSVRGSSETEAERAIRAAEAWKNACQWIGMETSAILIDVCFLHNGTGRRRDDQRRWRRFCDGLESLADYWGIQPDLDR